MPDILTDLGNIALGSRLKRLAERLQTDAAQVFEQAGFVTQPSHFPLLAALDRYGPLTVGEAVDALGVSQPAVTRVLASLIDLGLVTATVSRTDRRQKTILLTKAGMDTVARMKREIWPGVGQAVKNMCSGPNVGLLDQIARLEVALDAAPLATRLHQRLSIIEYTDDLAESFYRINEEWLSAMFEMEDTDKDVLSNPRERIIDPGGMILFVSTPKLGIVGTCALMEIEPGSFELTKMGVLETARGYKAGEFLLAATLDRAKTMNMDKLFLLTNQKCAAAIHLYEKLGFQHDDKIMDQYGARYERCNVAMSYPLSGQGPAS